MKLQFFSLIIFTCTYHTCNGMQPYQLPPCKKIAARKMLASPYREIYADVLQEQAIAKKPEQSLVVECADLLKNETIECLKRACKDPNSSNPNCFISPAVAERLHNQIVIHLNNIGDLTNEQQRIMMVLDPSLEKTEKRRLKAKLAVLKSQLSAAAVQLYIAQHALSLRETAIILQEERNKQRT